MPQRALKKLNSARVRAVILFHSRRPCCTMRTTKTAATAATPIDARETLGAPAGGAVRVVGVACGAGAPDPRCAAGPAALRKHGLVGELRQAGMDAAWSTTIAPPPGGDTFTVVSTVAEALAARIEELV